MRFCFATAGMKNVSSWFPLLFLRKFEIKEKNNASTPQKFKKVGLNTSEGPDEVAWLTPSRDRKRNQHYYSLLKIQ